MTLREWMLAGLLAVAAAAVVIGVSGWSSEAAWVVAGVLSAVWAWFVFADDGGAS